MREYFFAKKKDLKGIYMLSQHEWDDAIKYLDDDTAVNFMRYETLLDRFNYTRHTVKLKHLISDAESHEIYLKDLLSAFYNTTGRQLGEDLGVTFVDTITTEQIFIFLDTLYNFTKADGEEARDLMESLLSDEDSSLDDFITMIMKEYENWGSTSGGDYVYLIATFTQELESYVWGTRVTHTDIESFTEISHHLHGLVKTIGLEPSKAVKTHLFEFGREFGLERYWEELRGFIVGDRSAKAIAIDVYFLLHFANDTSIMIEDYRREIEPKLSNGLEVRGELTRLLGK